MIPNNVRTVRITAAAGTNLARASSEAMSNRMDYELPPGTSSPLTAVYNPRAFIPHAASLGQACAHCRRFSTAATRRCLGSISVPVTRVVLSHPLPIIALVSRYLTNQLIRGRPLLRWNHTFALETITSREIIGYYPQFPVAIPDPRVRHLPVTTPFAAVPLAGSRSTCMPNPRRQRSF